MKDDTIYIVSGLPRSGTSMLMQMMKAGGMEVATDEKRIPDKDNPAGYIEVENIINKLEDEPERIFNFKGKFVKVIAYGLKYLPEGKYKIVYSDRNVEEVLDSMDKMVGRKDEEREEAREAFIKLNNIVKNRVREREDVEVLFVNYNDILANPEEKIAEIYEFLREDGADLEKMVGVVRPDLYRNRREG
jgi:hypothetical protein